MRRRGMTFLETTLALGLTGAVLAGGVQVWQFALRRANIELTRAALDQQAVDLMKSLEREITPAVYVERRTLSGVSGILVGLPMGEDYNHDTFADHVRPTQVLSEATTRYGVSEFRWIYSTGNDLRTGSANGGFLTRFRTPRDYLDDFGGASGTSPEWSRRMDLPGTPSRWPGLESISFSVSALNQQVTVDATFSALAGDPHTNRLPIGSQSPDTVRTVVTRAFRWRNAP